MWMQREFARWEVEGRVEERITDALREAEQARLVRAARGTKTRLTLRDAVSFAKAALRGTNLRAGLLQLQEPTT